MFTSIFNLPFLFGSAFRGSNAAAGADAAGAGLAAVGGVVAATGCGGAGVVLGEVSLDAAGFGAVGDDFSRGFAAGDVPTAGTLAGVEEGDGGSATATGGACCGC